MNIAVPHIDIDLVHYLKEKYFGDELKRICISQGEYLIRNDETNDRLFLVLEGLCAGYLKSESGTQYEVFQSSENMFVGVHSFFSKSRSVYADVIALQDCTVAYIDHEDHRTSETNDFYADFMPLVVHELSIRQRWAKSVTMQNEATTKKLYHADKMATLGQMAAGLAHELNNAIGVVKGNAEWLSKEVSAYFKEKEDQTVYTDFQNGFEKGQVLASYEIRNRKKKIEKKFKVSSGVAKLLAKVGLSDKGIAQVNKDELEAYIENKHRFWQYGVALHDVLIASNQASHVLKSIKHLSVSDQVRQSVNVNQSINEALVLLKNNTRDITLKTKYAETLPNINASSGELIQIWVNIIKNACESLQKGTTEHPELCIVSKLQKKQILVEVSNNGPEISEEVIQKIFQPNFTTKKGGLTIGLGLGLSIVQKLVEGYNGKIGVESKKGKTKFSIFIPLN